MRIGLLTLLMLALLPAGFRRRSDATSDSAIRAGYLGFDRNDYPGDANLKQLRQTFLFSGYWLNNPPGARTNSWLGKRKTLEAAGFGFIVIFNGRTYKEIKSAGDPIKLGRSDAASAIQASRAQGFPLNTTIFLDQEEGGRLLAEQRAYLHAWVDGVNSAHFTAGVYCSGIAFKEGSGVSIVTAEDIRQNAEGRQIKFWVVNDSCPPSPGCALPKRPFSPSSSGISFADAWQFSQSPMRKNFAAQCAATYNNKDGNCYPPGIDLTEKLHVDFDVATSADPSHGRTR